ncbi:hypothetical protein KUTeg_004562 [Tegillarca granosa]|uniref:NTR domain-containing protein n=1 Tax=Tegillarca granosa TaxID=220873 RepID=A0ABQ9FRV7_TEGGR|nr:hypothetical protein KUTeg_004562 [Tegillarca granosa]
MSPPHWLQYILLSFYCVFWTVIAQQYCDQCDCSISENIGEGRGVRNVKPPCVEGKITWVSPYGAVRIELNPGFPDFEACFIVEAKNLRAQVSQELTDYKLVLNEHPSSLKPLITVSGRTQEYCMNSKSGPIILFVEPERNIQDAGLPKIVFQYDITRKNSIFYFNPMEDCRPCTERELIRAYCSSDFVIRASVENIIHKDTNKHSEISVSISRIVRQKNQDLFYRTSRNSPNLQGKLHTPRKCDISRTIGDYLFTGRLRLGQLHVTCAAYIKEWENILHRALELGTMECSLD